MFPSGSIQSSTNNYSFGYDVSISADGNTIVGGGYGDYGMSGVQMHVVVQVMLDI